jgi:hypothetical protein
MTVTAPAIVPGRSLPSALRRSKATTEVIVVAVVATIVNIVMTWPLARYLGSRVPGHPNDPTLLSWTLAWDGHGVLTGNLWNGNIYYPLPDTLALNDSLLGFLPLSLIGSGPVAAVIRHNIVWLLVPVLTAIGGYALVRQLGARIPAAVLAAVVVTWAPWRLAQLSHFQVLCTGGALIAVAALVRGHGLSLTGGYQKQLVRPGWIVFGWAAAAWQIAVGWTVGLPMLYLLLGLCALAVLFWLLAKRPPVPATLIVTDLVCGGLFAAFSAVIAIPYLKALSLYPGAVPFRLRDLNYYSEPVASFFTAPPDSLVWGAATAGLRAQVYASEEMWIFPGLVLLVFAAAGLFYSRWSLRARLMLAAGVAVTVILVMGTKFFGGHLTYLPLVHHLPGWSSSRTPGRLIFVTAMLLAILAAGSVSKLLDLGERWASTARPRRWAVAVAAVLTVLLALAEGAGSTQTTPFVPTPPGFSTAAPPILVLPSSSQADSTPLLWSTDGFPALRNGYGGYTPKEIGTTRKLTESFPDAASIQHLRSIGVRTVFVDTTRLAGTPYAGVPGRSIAGLSITRRVVGTSIIYQIPPG